MQLLEYFYRTCSIMLKFITEVKYTNTDNFDVKIGISLHYKPGTVEMSKHRKEVKGFSIFLPLKKFQTFS